MGRALVLSLNLQSTRSTNSVFLGFYGDLITQSCLIKSLAIGDSLALQSSPCPGGWEGEVGCGGGGTESPSPLVTWLALLEASLHPEVLSKSPLTHATKDLYPIVTKEMPGVFRALCQKQMKTTEI